MSENHILEQVRSAELIEQVGVVRTRAAASLDRVGERVRRTATDTVKLALWTRASVIMDETQESI